jgi:hypothetical protein
MHLTIKHKLHWPQQTLNTMVCLAHLLCTSLLLSASAWIHTSLRTPSQPRSYTVYTSLLISNLAQVQDHHSRDMLTTTVQPHYPLLSKPLPGCNILMTNFFYPPFCTLTSLNLPFSHPLSFPLAALKNLRYNPLLPISLSPTSLQAWLWRPPWSRPTQEILAPLLPSSMNTSYTYPGHLPTNKPSSSLLNSPRTPHNPQTCTENTHIHPSITHAHIILEHHSTSHTHRPHQLTCTTFSPQLKPVPTNSSYVPTITNAPLQLPLILLTHTRPFNTPISYKNHSTHNTDFAPTLPRCLTRNTTSPIKFYHNPYIQHHHKLDSCSSNPINHSSSPLLTLPPSPASICTFLPTSFILIQIHRYHLISWLSSFYAPTPSHWRHSHLYAHSCLSCLCNNPNLPPATHLAPQSSRNPHPTFPEQTISQFIQQTAPTKFPFISLSQHTPLANPTHPHKNLTSPNFRQYPNYANLYTPTFTLPPQACTHIPQIKNYTLSPHN